MWGFNWKEWRVIKGCEQDKYNKNSGEIGEKIEYIIRIEIGKIQGKAG